MALGGVCGAVRFDRTVAEPHGVGEMLAALPWRCAGGAPLSDRGAAVMASPVPGAADWPARGLAERGRVTAVADARLIRQRELAVAIGPDALPTDRPPTDADLVLGGYLRWGEELPDHLLGEYAIAVWDADREVLVCARDPVGARPLCYSTSGATFRFASSPIQVLGAGDIQVRLDGLALVDFLVGRFEDHERTGFSSVRKVPPGCVLIHDRSGTRVRRYWHPEQAEWVSRHDRDGWVEAFRTLLFDVVEDHLSDAAPAAALMTSGGIDSSSIAAISQQLYRQGRIRARPIAFVETFDRLRECDEWEFASALGEETGMDVVRLAVDDLTDLVPASEEWGGAEGPADGPVVFGGELTARVLAVVREHGCRALTTGFGGDSLFDAARWQYYDHVRGGRIDRVWPWLDQRARRTSWPRAIAGVLVPPLLTNGGRRRLDRWRGTGRYWQAPPWVAPRLRRTGDSRLRSIDLPRRFQGFARQRQYEHIVGLAQQGPAIEVWSVHGSRHGVEPRFPLLDRRLAEMVLAAPVELGARPGPAGSKWLLREALNGILPERIRRRDDKGSWGGHVRYHLCADVRRDFRARLRGSVMGDLGLVDDAVLADRLEGFCAAGAGHHREGNLLSFAYLLERWLASPGLSYAGVDFTS